MSNTVYLSLLEQLNQYDFELEQLSKCFIEGFNQLSRANYYNKDSLFGSKYGSMYYDMNYEGQLYVQINENENQLNILNKNDLDKNTDNEISSSISSSTSNLKQRNTNKIRNGNFIEKIGNNNNNTDTVEKNKGPYDPIKMFAGGFNVPRQLRNSQQQFQCSIPIIQSLINRRNNINKLIDQLMKQQS